MTATLRVGTAGWSVPRRPESILPAGSHLERYAQLFNCVEINTTFYRPHREATYRRWAAAVPHDFCFAVKARQSISHDLRLIDASAAFGQFVAEVSALGDKLGPLLLQLPPSLEFDRAVVHEFLASVRSQFGGGLAVEPRHASWASREASEVLASFSVARVRADPERCVVAHDERSGVELTYFRMHGSPRVYYSEYTPEAIARLGRQMLELAGISKSVWCIFDNTASGAAFHNARTLATSLRVR